MFWDFKFNIFGVIMSVITSVMTKYIERIKIRKEGFKKIKKISNNLKFNIEAYFYIEEEFCNFYKNIEFFNLDEDVVCYKYISKEIEEIKFKLREFFTKNRIFYSHKKEFRNPFFSNRNGQNISRFIEQNQIDYRTISPYINTYKEYIMIPIKYDNGTKCFDVGDDSMYVDGKSFHGDEYLNKEECLKQKENYIKNINLDIKRLTDLKEYIENLRENIIQKCDILNNLLDNKINGFWKNKYNFIKIFFIQKYPKLIELISNIYKFLK